MLRKLCPILAGFFLAPPFYVVAQKLNPLAFIETAGAIYSVKAAGSYLYLSEYRSLPAPHSLREQKGLACIIKTACFTQRMEAACESMMSPSLTR